MHYLLEALGNRVTEGRDPGKTHDYSSSRYNAFDDGFIAGVYEAVDAVEGLIAQGKLTWAGEER